MINVKTVIAALEAAGFGRTVSHSFGYIFASRRGEEFEVFNGKPEFKDPATGETITLVRKKSPFYKKEIAEITYTGKDGEVHYRSSVVNE
jgi:hypothetical protein